MKKVKILSIVSLLMLLSCQKEEVLPNDNWDKLLIGEWNGVGGIDGNGRREDRPPYAIFIYYEQGLVFYPDNNMSYRRYNREDSTWMTAVVDNLEYQLNKRDSVLTLMYERGGSDEIIQDYKIVKLNDTQLTLYLEKGAGGLKGTYELIKGK